MERSERYVLGVDGLPLGSHAAVAHGRRITATFVVGEGEARAVQHLGLDMHVRTAVTQAQALLGRSVDEVRLVCLDDGAAGRAIDDLAVWLAEEAGGATLSVLDLVKVDPVPTGPASDGGTQADIDDRSMRRARSAALW